MASDACIQKKVIQEGNFERMLAHAGWGDPIGGLWFIGIEEGSEWRGSTAAVEQWFDERRDSIHKLGDMTYEYGTSCEGLPAATRSKVGYWEQAIVDRLANANGMSPPVVPSLWSPGSRVFHANLYPLARTSMAAWPEYFAAMFGVSSCDSYQEAVHDHRFRKLRDARHSAGVQATVCFGKSCWPAFEKALALEPAAGRMEPGGNLKRYDEARVICAPFFGYWHMNASLAGEIVAILREWRVDLGY